MEKATFSFRIYNIWQILKADAFFSYFSQLRPSIQLNSCLKIAPTICLIDTFNPRAAIHRLSTDIKRLFSFLDLDSIPTVVYIPTLFALDQLKLYILIWELAPTQIFNLFHANIWIWNFLFSDDFCRQNECMGLLNILEI